MTAGSRTPTAPPKKKRGRPPKQSSGETRERLIESARKTFAQNGFDGAAVSEICHGAGIGASAFYHHFPDKEALYEAVFEDTITHLWGVLDARAHGHDTARDAIAALIEAADEAGSGLPYYPEYLTGVPLEASRHPQFRALLGRRTAMQRRTFNHIATLGRTTGEFSTTMLSDDELAEHLRFTVMGWLVERGLQLDTVSVESGGLLHLLGLDRTTAAAPAHGR